jgi:hypothetical protein
VKTEYRNVVQIVENKKIEELLVARVGYHDFLYHGRIGGDEHGEHVRVKFKERLYRIHNIVDVNSKQVRRSRDTYVTRLIDPWAAYRP